MDACATFEHKWSNAFPEFGLALRFLPESSRRERSALACIGFEIEHVALRIDEPQVAAGKLNWWMEELLSMRSGTPRHPLTEAVAGAATAGAVAASDWHRLAIEAMAQRELAPSASLDQRLAVCRPFHLAFSHIESALFGDGDAHVRADALALSRALRDAVAIDAAHARGELSLPLDLLARHHLTRAELGVDDRVRDAALREYFDALAARMRGLDPHALSVIGAASLHADRVRSVRIARSPRPLVRAREQIARLPISTVWSAWRVARRHRLQAANALHDP